MPAGMVAGGGTPGPTDDAHVAALAGRDSAIEEITSRDARTILTTRSTRGRSSRDGLGQDLGDVADREAVVRRIGGAAQVQEAARVVGHKHRRARRAHVLQLAAGDLAGE